MSCRTTASGSLATTFIGRRYGLHDAQCTSLYHALRREANLGAPASVTSREYLETVENMKFAIEIGDGWTESLRRRARDRVTRAIAAGLPTDNAEAWVFVNIDNRARVASETLDRFLHAQSVANRMTSDDMQSEFNRLYTDIDRTFLARMSPLPAGWFPDDGTQYAVRAILQGNRCTRCGQFISSARSHTCSSNEISQPFEERHPPVPPASIPAPARPRVRVQRATEPVTRTRSPRPRTVPIRRRTTPVVPTLEPVAPQPLTVSWVQDMEAFQNTYDKMKARLDNGEQYAPVFPELESIPGGITGGLSTPATGTTFGLELEIDFPDDEYPYRKRYELAQRLFEEGITLSPVVNRWHFVGNEGEDRPGGTFRQTPDEWSCEFDRTVDDVDGERGVEIKSQILYDEPRTWHNLSRICAIARDLGGKPTQRCGLHVNVGAQGYPADNPANHTNLLRLAASYDDTLTRLAHNPLSGPMHRGRHYCSPNMIPPAGFTSVDEVRVWANHYQAFNMNNMPAPHNPARQSSRLEVRLFDSSLDAGRIQAQVAVTLGIVSAGRNGVQPMQPAEYAGAHRNAYGTRRLSGERWESSTASVRQLADIIGTQGLQKSEHKEMLAWLFVSGKWANVPNHDIDNEEYDD